MELEGPLPSLVDSIMLFLKKHAMRGADFSDLVCGCVLFFR